MNEDGSSTDTQVLAGIEMLCDSYLALEASDKVLLLYSEELDDGQAAQSLLSSVKERMNPQVRDVCLEPAGGFDERRLEDCDVLVLASMVASVHRMEVLQYLAARKRKIRVHRLFNFSPELFKLALSVEHSQLDGLNDRVIRAARSAHEVRVTNGAGTDVRIGLLPHGGWTNSCGKFDGQFPAVLPPGEVNTYSPHVTGVVVADGAINTSFGFPGDPCLSSHPVRLDIEESRVLNYSCDSPVISQVLDGFLTVENADRVGEVGFGTNEGITDWVGFVSHINERHPGLHLGLGTPSQPQSKVGWSSPLHLDLILDNTAITFDGVPVFSNGTWNRQALDTLGREVKTPEILHVDAV